MWPDLAPPCAEEARVRVQSYSTLGRMVGETWVLYISLLRQKGREAA